MAGRKRKLGPRYPNGDLKPQGEPIVPAIWARIRSEAVKLTGDKRLESEVGRLSFHRELTDTQASMAFRIAAVYADYEASRQYSRHARAANYEGGSRGGACEDETIKVWQMEGLADADPLKKRMMAAIAARDAFMFLQEELGAFTRPQVEMLEQLCVNDRHIGATDLWKLRELLDYLSKRYKIGNSEKKAKRAERNTRLLRAHPKTTTTAATPAKRAESVERMVLQTLLKTMRPDLNAHAVSQACAIAETLREREIFRRMKKRPPRGTAVPHEKITAPGD